MLPAIIKGYSITGNEFKELTVVNSKLKKEIGEQEEKSLDETRAKQLKDIHDKGRAALLRRRKKRTFSKTKNGTNRVV